MEDPTTQPALLTPVLTNSKIIPVVHEEVLDDPTNRKATYSANNKELVFTCTITIPVELTLDDVTVYQYYEAGTLPIMDFYFVYNYTGHVLSGLFHPYNVKVSALKKNENNTPIPLASVTAVGSLIEDIDPKTSRRTVTTVRSITGEENE